MTMDTNPDEARIDSASYFCHLDPYPSWPEVKKQFDALYAARDRFLLFTAYGPWEATWRHHGMEDLLMDALAEPEWCAEMFETYTSLLLDVLQACLDRGMKPDGIYIPEDMGFKTGLMIGPSTWDRLLRPCYERIRDFTRTHGISFWMHSDGQVYDLIERFLETGVTALNPLECAAGMDIAELRRRFGKRMTCYGNISAAGLLGPWEDLEAELQRKIPFATNGGFIMHSDHSIPFGVTYAQYKRALQRAREIFAQSP
jgi:uroporphyrinogen decarboxylase